MSNPATAPTGGPAIRLSALLRRPVLDTKGNRIGTLADAIVRLQEGNYPRLTGLVIAIGATRVFAPLEQLSSLAPDTIALHTATLDLRPFTRREGEVLLNEDVLGHRLIDTDHTLMVKAYDIELNPTDTGWTATGLDVHKPRWFSLNRGHDTHPFLDWNRFLPLIGHEASSKTRALSARFAQLKPAQIADLIEDSSDKEQDEILARVHTDPELEADVFEELDEDRQSKILKDRTDADVADVLSHMRADDAADALMDLPQERRTGILTLLPAAQHTKVMTLLGYHDATAGGLMGTDYIALPATATIADALESIRTATTKQPEALTTIYTLNPDRTLAGVIGLVQALQADPAALLAETADPEPVSATAGDDIIDVTTTMADYNLLTLPVLDDHGHILGVVTVDDALEAAIPPDWAHREPNRNTTSHHAPED
ncbi:CBS domain-containing protein [Pseudarthrobacter sp. NPDC080039]|uniref:magnesium transporter MgtE N-terminal domain-containing protein n=1 Tax=unclassified Pseudarthrobacter TaxID=2647000 RepID=UPI00344C1BAC